MDHHFTGPRYTVGIEEELMILDADSLDLASAIDRIMAAGPASDQIKPELLESVLEIATAALLIDRRGRRGTDRRCAPRRAAERAGRASRSARPERIRSRAGRTSGWSATTATAA